MKFEFGVDRDKQACHNHVMFFPWFTFLSKKLKSAIFMTCLLGPFFSTISICRPYSFHCGLNHLFLSLGQRKMHFYQPSQPVRQLFEPWNQVCLPEHACAAALWNGQSNQKVKGNTTQTLSNSRLLHCICRLTAWTVINTHCFILHAGEPWSETNTRVEAG